MSRLQMSPRTVWLATVGLGRNFGGVSHVARTTLQALMSRSSDWKVERIVSLFDPAGVALPVEVPDGAAVTYCGRNRPGFAGSIARQVFRKPDIIIFDHVDIARCQTFFPRSWRAGYAVWVHGVEVWKYLPPRKLKALRDAGLLLVNSNFTLRRLEEWHGAFPRAVTVPLSGGEAIPGAPVPFGERPPHFLTVGRLEPGRPKGHREILAALPAIIQAVPEVHWHIVGTGTGFSNLESEVQASGLGNWVTLHGFTEPEKLDRLFRQSRLFCMPSEGEGFGVVYLEAMARGCIPVGSLMDAASEVIGEAGLCIDQRQAGTVAEAVIRLLTLPDEEASRRQSICLSRAACFSQEAFSSNLLNALQAGFDRGRPAA